MRKLLGLLAVACIAGPAFAELQTIAPVVTTTGAIVPGYEVSSRLTQRLWIPALDLKYYEVEYNGDPGSTIGRSAMSLLCTCLTTGVCPAGATGEPVGKSGIPFSLPSGTFVDWPRGTLEHVKGWNLSDPNRNALTNANLPFADWWDPRVVSDEGYSQIQYNISGALADFTLGDQLPGQSPPDPTENITGTDNILYPAPPSIPKWRSMVGIVCQYTRKIPDAVVVAMNNPPPVPVVGGVCPAPYVNYKCNISGNDASGKNAACASSPLGPYCVSKPGCPCANTATGDGHCFGSP